MKMKDEYIIYNIEIKLQMITDLKLPVTYEEWHRGAFQAVVASG